VERGGGRGGEKDIVCKVRVRVVTCIPLAAVFLGGCAPSILLKSLHGSHLSETSMPMVQDSFMFDMRKISFSPARQFMRNDFPCLALPKMLTREHWLLRTEPKTLRTSCTFRPSAPSALIHFWLLNWLIDSSF
jgi:hypothetical protein